LPAEEHVQRLDALDETGFELRPLGPRNHARNDVERDQPLGGILIAIDREGDADAPEQKLGLRAARFEQLGRGIGEPTSDALIDIPNGAIGQRHLVETRH
jgi:hypothetical protein